MTNLDVTPQNVSKTHRARNIVLGSVAVLALVAGTGTLAGCGNSSAKKVATSSPSDAPAYTPPTPVYTAPVFPPAPVVPTPAYTPPAPVYTPPVPTPTAKSGPEQLSFGDVAVITDGGSSAKVTVGAPRFSASNNSTDMPMTPTNGLYEAFTVSFVGVTGSFDANALSLYIRGADGTHYTGTTGLGFEPMLSASTLTPGEPLKGNIVFDVPSRTGTLVYESGLEALGEWK
jgi:Domain of unknown function (DUF1942)